MKKIVVIHNKNSRGKKLTRQNLQKIFDKNQLNCDIYATPFTAILVQEKFKEKKIDISNKIKLVKLNSEIILGIFTNLLLIMLYLGKAI